MKKIISSAVLLMMLSALLCSCNRITDINSSEIKNRLIILALGIDKADNGEILVSVQTLNTDVSSSTAGQSASENMVKCYSQRAKSVSQAISKLADLTGKNPLLSQNRIVLLGWELANEGISDYLDDFVRNTENRSSVLVAITQEKAEDVINAELGKNVIPARLAEQIIESSAQMSYTINTRVYDVLNGISDDKSCIAVPLIRLVKEKDENKIVADKTGIFKDDKLSSVKNSEITRGIIFACDDVKKGNVSFEYNNSNITLSILKSDTKTTVDIQNGVPHFKIKINASLSISEINSSISKRINDNDLKNIKYEAEKKIEKCVENSVNECIIKESTDVFGFGKRLMRNKAEYYKKNIEDWHKDMKKSSFSVEADVKIKGVGDSAAVLHG